MTDLAAGQLLTASLFNMKARKRVARARRVSNSSSSTSTTEVAVMRLDDIPILGGHNYRIGYQCTLDVGTNVDTLRTILRITTDGSTPTTSSGVLGGSGAEELLSNAATPVSNFTETDYSPASDELLSILLSVRHVVGTSAGIIQADGSVFHTQMYVDDMGDDPGDTGVDV